MKNYKIALIPGDGIGLEVVPATVKVLDKIAALSGFQFEYTEFDYSCEYYAKNGKMMPDDALDRLRDFDDIYLGAVGYPGVPDHVSLWGLLIPIRRTFSQYINIRPVRLLRGLESPLKNVGPNDVDFMIVRENNEGEYSEIGGRLYAGTEQETVVQQTIFTKIGVDRVMRYAFDLAVKGNKHVTSATKSNGIIHSMPFWDERFAAISAEYSDVKTDAYHIDILTSHFVLHPDWFDVVVASNLFGDILSDLGPAVVGGMGVAPGANINPEGDFPSMFEPVHGSAPDIAGQNIANPIAAFWTACMMLEHLELKEAADVVLEAIETVTEKGEVLTRDLGGNASTTDFTEAVLQVLG